MGQAASHPILVRIREALEAAGEALSGFVPGAVASTQKTAGRGPVTEADYAVNRVLRSKLLRDGESWISEESVDDLGRLEKNHLWIVDPLDGTAEFIAGIPEWCISIGWIEHGRAVAGGIYNPSTRELVLGSISTGVTYNGEPARVSSRNELRGALVLASRTEVECGQWDSFQNANFTIRPVGSVAYKMALVAAGLADATWTLRPKHEWDIAAGTALIESAGGFVQSLEGPPLIFNCRSLLLSGLIAGGADLRRDINLFLNSHKTASRGVT
jgi:myo-inositol-1(or 4)-monophosphatase